MSEVLLQLGFPVGIGAVGGFVAGYAVKKISKLIAVIVGLFIAALVYLSVKGIISMDYEALWNSLAGSLGLASSAFSWIVGVISLLPFATSFVVAFLLGFKLG
jgi:uncharacterized membrane protein (Fun14 family)